MSDSDCSENDLLLENSPLHQYISANVNSEQFSVATRSAIDPVSAKKSQPRSGGRTKNAAPRSVYGLFCRCLRLENSNVIFQESMPVALYTVVHSTPLLEAEDDAVVSTLATARERPCVGYPHIQRVLAITCLCLAYLTQRLFASSLSAASNRVMVDFDGELRQAVRVDPHKQKDEGGGTASSVFEFFLLLVGLLHLIHFVHYQMNRLFRYDRLLSKWSTVIYCCCNLRVNMRSLVLRAREREVIRCGYTMASSHVPVLYSTTQRQSQPDRSLALICAGTQTFFRDLRELALKFHEMLKMSSPDRSMAYSEEMFQLFNISQYQDAELEGLLTESDVNISTLNALCQVVGMIISETVRTLFMYCFLCDYDREIFRQCVDDFELVLSDYLSALDSFQQVFRVKTRLSNAESEIGPGKQRRDERILENTNNVALRSFGLHCEEMLARVVPLMESYERLDVESVEQLAETLQKAQVCLDDILIRLQPPPVVPDSANLVAPTESTAVESKVMLDSDKPVEITDEVFEAVVRETDPDTLVPDADDFEEPTLREKKAQAARLLLELRSILGERSKVTKQRERAAMERAGMKVGDSDGEEDGAEKLEEEEQREEVTVVQPNDVPFTFDHRSLGQCVVARAAEFGCQATEFCADSDSDE